jgi:competence protein ComGD
VKNNKGFTFLEMLLVLMITSLIFFTMAFPFTNFLDGQKIKEDINTLGSDLQVGQSYALTQGSKVKFKINSTSYQVYVEDKYIQEKEFHKGVKVGTNFKDNIISYNENGHINQAGTITFTKGDNTKEMVFTIGDGRYVIK